jgi:hypothetical protein
MPNPFSITAAADSVPLDAQGRGSTTFTVSNISGQLRRGRARLVPSDPGQASWLSLDGEAERNFAADGTQQYTVRVSSPPGAPVGRYTFGLDVVSVENPDEEWSQGPKVAFEVAPSQPPKKPFPWWIVVAVAVLLVAAVIGWLVWRNREPKVDEPKVPDEPKVVGVLERCRKDADCGANLTCALAAASDQGICVGKVGFSPCQADRACADGLHCNDGSCRGPLGFSPCSSDAQCGPALACLNSTCLGVAGFKGCGADTDCGGGLACQANVCLGRLHFRPCKEGECGAGLSCVDGQCIGAPGFHGCAAAADCLAGLECNSGACLGPFRYRTCSANSDCVPGLACGNGSCLHPPGASCSNDTECSTGHCVMRTRRVEIPMPFGPKIVKDIPEGLFCQ